MKLKLVENINLSEFFIDGIRNKDYDPKNVLSRIISSIEESDKYKCKSDSKSISILSKNDFIVKLDVDVSDKATCKIKFTDFKGDTKDLEYSLRRDNSSIIELSNSDVKDIMEEINSRILKVNTILSEASIKDLLKKIGSKLVTKVFGRDEFTEHVYTKIESAFKANTDFEGLKIHYSIQKKGDTKFTLRITSDDNFLLKIYFGISPAKDRLLIDQIVGCGRDNKTEHNLYANPKYNSLYKVLKLIGNKLNLNFKLDDIAAIATGSNEEERNQIRSENDPSAESQIAASSSSDTVRQLFINDSLKLKLNKPLNEAWDLGTANELLKDGKISEIDRGNIIRYFIFKELGKEKEKFDPENKIELAAAIQILNAIKGNGLNLDATPLLYFAKAYLEKNFNDGQITQVQMETLINDSYKDILQDYYKNTDSFIYDTEVWKNDEYKNLIKSLYKVDLLDLKRKKIKEKDLSQFIALIPDSLRAEARGCLSKEADKRGNFSITKDTGLKQILLKIRNYENLNKILSLFGEKSSTTSDSDDSTGTVAADNLVEYFKRNNTYNLEKVKEFLRKVYPKDSDPNLLKVIVLTSLKLAGIKNADKKLEELTGNNDSALSLQ